MADAGRHPGRAGPGTGAGHRGVQRDGSLDAELDDGLGDLLDGIIDDEEEEPAAAPEEPAAAPGAGAARERWSRPPARSRRPSPTRIARTSTSRRMLRRGRR